MVHGTSTDHCTSTAWCSHCQPPSPRFSRWILRAGSDCRVPGAGTRVWYGTKTVTNRKITAAVSKKPFHRYEITSPAPRSPMAGSTKERNHKKRRWRGCSGTRDVWGRSIPPSPQPGRSAPGRAAAHSALTCAFSASPVIRLPASKCAGRSWQSLPPFGDAGPSHPARKATVSRPLHLGPICCC